MPALQVDESLNDDNAHVQELRRIFLSCNVDENECLSAHGLSKLCDKLKLNAFAPEIVTRVLQGQDNVSFYDFKDRFVALLPEIIDVSSGNVDELATKSVQNIRKMQIGDNFFRLTRHETRLLCENTGELSALTSGDVSALFDRADSDRNGRVSIHQFLQQYRLQKRLSAEVHFIADSFVSTLNLFDALDTANTGTVDSHDLLEYWSKAGLRIDEGITVLKQCGQPISGTVNAVFLSGFLERELSDAAAEAPVAVKTAIIALHSCIDYLRCCIKEGETQTEYLQKQLQLANQRRTLLIEELEQNQVSIEQGYENRLRENEDRFRAKMVQFEEKAKVEKRELQIEIERCDEELSRSRQSENSMRNKMTMMERQCGRLNEEAREFTETISQLEQLNRQLRTELSKAMQPRPQDDNGNVLMWKQKTELLVAHNKRLREKVQELSLNQKKNKNSRDVNPLFTKWSPAFKTQVSMFRKRRLARGDTLSEMDSEPEAIFARVRRRRLRKRKDRKQRHERLLSRLSVQQDAESSSTSAESKPSTSREGAVASHKNVMKQLEERVQRLQEDHRRELMAMKMSAGKTLADALNEQEKQITSHWERQLDQRVSNERAQLEQAFAVEKTKLMSRLQDDFDSELQRLSASNINEGPVEIEQYRRQIKMLESSLEGQRNGYEKRLTEMKDKYRNQFRAHTSSVLIDKNASNFLSLVEKYRNMDPSTSMFEQPSPRALGVEKRHHHIHMPFQRSMSSMSSKCERCDLVDVRLRELYSTCTGDSTTSESGIEDLGSSAGSLSDDKIVLKREVRKLKGRLEAAKEKVTELRVLFSMQNGSVSARYKCQLGGSQDSQQTLEWRRSPPAKWGDVNATVERLESEKLILESRLTEAQLLIKNLVEQYRKQLDETARLGGILQDMYAQQSPSEASSAAKSAPPTTRN